MRYPAQHKEETHRRIVASASRVFRAQGFEGAGIAKLMGKLGLTHGGFYAHFADKEALVAEAVTTGLEESEAAILRALDEGGVEAMLDYYLSEAHRDHADVGCLLPALAAEVGRHPGATQGAFTGRFAELVESLAERLPGASRAARQDRARATLAAMAGAVSLARAVSDPALSAAILRSTRESLRASLTSA